MTKFGYTVIIAVSFLAFSSCSHFYYKESQKENATISSIPSNNYGTYLAARIAHYRQDFNTAADYYMKTIKNDTQNTSLLNKTYLILASQGRIDEAAKYAKLAQEKNEVNEYTSIIIAVEQFKQNDFKESLNTVRNIKSPLYEKLITPFLESWAYAGLNKYDKATKSLNKIKKEKGMEALYHFHAGMINDYFNKPDIAKQHYESIINDSRMDLSIRTLEIICNFYIRNNEKDKAVALSQKFAGTTPSFNILQSIHKKNLAANAETTPPILTSSQVGLSEALFNIASVIKHNSEAIDFSHIFIRLAIYENPQNDLARVLLANILEMREMYKDAIDIYDEISITSPAYYIAQYKKAENLRNLNDYKGSELLLKSLILDYPDDYQTFLDLGDTLRLQEKYKEALKYYNQVLNKYPDISKKMWQVYYALGITYDKLNDWSKAEEMLQKGLEINPDNLLILNYLGYSWLKQEKSPEKAFEYIVRAYNQAPFNSSIIDSLGWAFYSIGQYNEAIKYLEKATEIEPSSAVINEHLGDAYWQGGRKNEARFQWNHASTLKDDTGEVDKEIIKQKIQEGMQPHSPININKDKLKELIAQLPEKNK